VASEIQKDAYDEAIRIKPVIKKDCNIKVDE
jgi:hypothetical protein